MKCVPAWLGVPYSKLYLSFRCEPFTLASAFSRAVRDAEFVFGSVAKLLREWLSLG